jgi:hypothetical protein
MSDTPTPVRCSTSQICAIDTVSPQRSSVKPTT